MLEIGIVAQIAIDPVGEGQLFLHSDLPRGEKINNYYLRNRLSGYIIANSQQMFGLFHLAVHTEWVVPSDEASEVPPIVSKFSLLFTIFLKVVATSCDLSRAHNWF